MPSALAATFTRSTEPDLTPFVLDVADCLDDLLTAWSADIDGTTQQWNGVSPLPDYWFLAAAPAGAGALYDRVISGNKWRSQAIATIDGALALYAQPNGSLGQTSGGDNSIDTMEFMKILATCLLVYGDDLAAARKAIWTETLLDAAGYLQAHGNLAYYTNGNINAGNFEALRLAYKITGDYTVGQYAEKAWWTLHDPEASINVTWAGYGYFFTGSPDPDTALPFDGNTSTAYFTEEGGGGNGLDWDYTQLNLSQLSFLYLWDRDPRLARLINLELNTLWPRVNTTTWELNSMGGTRQGFAAPTTPRPISFDTSALIIANNLLGRTGLDDHESQFYDGNGGIFNTYGVVGPASTAPGIYRGSYQELGAFLNVAAGL